MEMVEQELMEIIRLVLYHSTRATTIQYEDDEAMKYSTEFAIQEQQTTDNDGCHIHILLEAGIDPRMSMYCAIRANDNILCQLLVREYQVDPFLVQERNTENDDDEESDDDDDEAAAAAAAASPFLAAARLADTSIFEFFLGIRDLRFAASTTGDHGKNDDGDYPIYVVCCNPCVSLQAVKVLVNRQADALAEVDGQQGLLPVHFAANWGASLDVIFYLLQHCPDALRHGGTTATTAAAAAAAAAADVPPIYPSSFPAVGTSGSTTDMAETSSDGPAKKKTKTRHSG